MSPEQIIRELEYNAFTFESILKDLINEMIYWKPDGESWSILEVVCHLIDEEKEDFRPRILHTLHHPETTPPPVNPEEWPLKHNYLEQSFPLKSDELLHERNLSIVTLKNLHNPDWEAGYEHPKWGRVTASFFLHNWLAHDYLHIRQITKLKYKFLKNSANIDFSYAGQWN